MNVFEFAAIAAAACWALSSIINAGPAAHLGAIAFTRSRMTIVMVMLVGSTAIGTLLVVWLVRKLCFGPGERLLLRPGNR